MKFEYESKQDDRECVAYLHSNGGLFLNAIEVYSVDGLNQGAVGIGGKYNATKMVKPNGTGDISIIMRNDEHTGRKFYPGDKITITF